MKSPSIIFDLDGTLFDSRESILSSIYFAFAKLGRSEKVDEIKALRQDLWTTLRETGERYGTRFSDEERFRFIQTYRAHQKDTIAKMLKPFESVPDVLADLGKSFSLGVATTKTTEQAVHILEEFKLDQFFGHIQGTDKGLRYKPAPDILLRTMDKLNNAGGLAAYVGDSPHDLLSAKNAGMLSIGAVYGYSELHELESETPDYVIHQFDELLAIKDRLFLGASSEKALIS
ncbi:MAG: hypothetical protein JWQ35_711 [Bacteriovoracaceae bacterium]|nr:hypothetical protein [Bacteriovoracaceae bacterium]